MSALFVTSSGTGIGKTLVTAALAHQFRSRGETVDVFKPVLSGFDIRDIEATDTAVLLHSLDTAITREAIERVSPWRFAEPLSPDMAAEREGRTIDFAELVRLCRERIDRSPRLLIEGVGGVMVPLSTDRTVLDWIEALDVPALLVVGSYLGTISHTLTARHALEARGIRCQGIVVSESEESPVPIQETCAAIGRFAPGVRIVSLPRLTGGQPWREAPELLAPLDL